jgi:acyl dehydratase
VPSSGPNRARNAVIRLAPARSGDGVHNGWSADVGIAEERSQRPMGHTGGMSDAPDAVEPIEPRGRWFEELPEGLVVRHALTRTVTEADNLAFCTMTHNPQPLHLDAEFAAGTEFGQRLVNSLFTLGLVVGVSVADTTLGTTVANLGFEETVFPAPVFIGDTLRFETEVAGVRDSRSRPECGIVTFEHRAFNQRGDLVCRCRRNALMWRDPSGIVAD